jgi:hypothetical protein
MGELLVMRFEAKTGVTEGFSLQATENIPHEKPESVFTERLVLYSNPEVRLSPEPVSTVRVRRKHGPDRKSREILGRIVAEKSWPPSTIPALDWTCYKRDGSLGNGEDYSTELFRLQQENSWITFAAIGPMLFTPDVLSPYKGVWTGMPLLILTVLKKIMIVAF